MHIYFMEKEKNMEIFMLAKFQVPHSWPYHNSNLCCLPRVFDGSRLK